MSTSLESFRQYQSQKQFETPPKEVEPITFGEYTNFLEDTTSPYYKCDKAAARKTVEKQGPNKGREFWTCETRTCKFFVWVEPRPTDKIFPQKRKAEDTNNNQNKKPARDESTLTALTLLQAKLKCVEEEHTKQFEELLSINREIHRNIQLLLEKK